MVTGLPGRFGAASHVQCVELLQYEVVAPMILVIATT